MGNKVLIFFQSIILCTICTSTFAFTKEQRRNMFNDYMPPIMQIEKVVNANRGNVKTHGTNPKKAHDFLNRKIELEDLVNEKIPIQTRTSENTVTRPTIKRMRDFLNLESQLRDTKKTDNSIKPSVVDNIFVKRNLTRFLSERNDEVKLQAMHLSVKDIQKLKSILVANVFHHHKPVVRHQAKHASRAPMQWFITVPNR